MIILLVLVSSILSTEARSIVCRGSKCPPQLQATAKHVVHIGVDGMKPSCIQDVMPNIMTRLGTEGSSTLTNARTVIETVSAPAWSAFLCAMNSVHNGVTGNSWTPPWEGNAVGITPVTGLNKPFPCVFQVIKEQNSSVQTGSFYDWNWLRYLMNQAVPGSIDNEYYCNPSDYPGGYSECDALVAQSSSDYLENILASAQKSYTFIYFAHLDNVGHSSGWCSQAYLDYASIADGQVGQILDAIEASGQEDQTLVMLSSDHGGEGYSHGCQKDSCLLIPMFLRGPSVQVNYQLNQTVRNMDMVPTALYALGLQPNKHWQGKIMAEAFQN